VYRLDHDPKKGTSKNALLFDTKEEISSFGQDPAGELYFTAFNGKIYKIK